MRSPKQRPAEASELVGRIGAGDRQAEAELVQQFSPGLSRLLRYLTRDHALSEDLHQETFRIVLQKLRDQELREPSKLPGFIRTTAKNLHRAEYRKSSRRRTEGVEAIQDAPDPAPSQLSQVLQEEDKKLVRQVLAELRSDRDRQILYRFHIAEEGKERICRSLDLGPLQFNLVLFRARRRFKELLHKHERRSKRGELEKP